MRTRLKENRATVRAKFTFARKVLPATYRVRIHRVWGEVAAGKVTVDVYTHLRSGEVQHERQQLAIGDKDAMVVFDLNHGRRSEPLESAQLAGAVKRQETISRAVLAQQISRRFRSKRASRTGRCDAIWRGRQPSLEARGAVGFQPIVQTLAEGTMMTASAVVSADRRYVRIAAFPSFNHDRRRANLHVCRPGPASTGTPAAGTHWTAGAAGGAVAP